MKRRVVFSRAAERDFRRVSSRTTLLRLSVAINALAEVPNPPGARKLAGFNEVWRLRVGDYRVCYRWEDDELVILVLAVARRADVYERLRRRFG